VRKGGGHREAKRGRTVVRTTRLVRCVSGDIKDLTLDCDITEATVHSYMHISVSFLVLADEELRDRNQIAPLHCERNSLEMGSLLGGLSCTGVLGSNLPAMARGR
jgi:hypothetical protein